MPNAIPKDAKVITGFMKHDPYTEQNNYQYFASRPDTGNKWTITNLDTGEVSRVPSDIFRNSELTSVEKAVNSDVTITPYELKTLQTALQNNEFIGHGFHKGNVTTYDFNEIKSNLPLSQPESETRLVASGNVSLSPDYVVWNLDTNGMLTVYGNGAIPDFKEGDYCSWADCLKDVHTIKIEDGITRIGNNAFESPSKDAYTHDKKNCDNLVFVEIADSVKSIGEGAFENCANLRNVIAPNELYSIENSAFSGCENLQHVYVEDKATAMNPFPVPSEVHFISETAFLSCNKLEQPLVETPKNEIDNKLPELNNDVINAIKKSGWEVGNVQFAKSGSDKEFTVTLNNKEFVEAYGNIKVNFDGSNLDFLNKILKQMPFPADFSKEARNTINQATYLDTSTMMEALQDWADLEKTYDNLYYNLSLAQGKELENDLDNIIEYVNFNEKPEPVKESTKTHSHQPPSKDKGLI